MSYKNEKMELVDEIVGLLEITKNLEVLRDVRDELKKEPVNIMDFIRDLFDTNYNEGIYKSNDILCAFEHAIRSISYKLKYDGSSEKIFKKIEANSEYIDHYCELNVDGLVLDLWISENNDTPFDPKDIAWTIFNIYCGKVVFSK